MDGLADILEGSSVARHDPNVVERGVFTYVKDLNRKLMPCIGAYAKTARPFPIEVL